MMENTVNSFSIICASSMSSSSALTPRHRTRTSAEDAAILRQPSVAAQERVSAAAYRTATPWMPRPSGDRFSYVHAVRQKCHCRLCRAKLSSARVLALQRWATRVASLADLPSQLLPTTANNGRLLHLWAPPAGPPRFCATRHRARMSLGEVGIRAQPSGAAMENVGAVANRTGTPWMTRPTGARMSDVHARRQGYQCRHCRA